MIGAGRVGSRVEVGRAIKHCHDPQSSTNDVVDDIAHIPFVARCRECELLNGDAVDDALCLLNGAAQIEVAVSAGVTI